MKEPTHILHIFSPFIDLIFASQPNLIIESGVHPSLHPNCHHQLIYVKFKFTITIERGLERSGTTMMQILNLFRRSVDEYNWQKSISEQKCKIKSEYFQ